MRGSPLVLGILMLCAMGLTPPPALHAQPAENPMLGISKVLILDREAAPLHLRADASPETVLSTLLKAAKNRGRNLLLFVLSASSTHALSFFTDTIKNEEFFPEARKKHFLAAILAEQQRDLVNRLDIIRLPSTMQFDDKGKVLSVFVGHWPMEDLLAGLKGAFPPFAKKFLLEEASDPLRVAEYDPTLYSDPEAMNVEARNRSAIEKIQLGMTRREVLNLVGEARSIRTMGNETTLTIYIPFEKKIDAKTTRYIHQLWYVILEDDKVREIRKVPQ